jgi:kinesin family protein C1
MALRTHSAPSATVQNKRKSPESQTIVDENSNENHSATPVLGEVTDEERDLKRVRAGHNLSSPLRSTRSTALPRPPIRASGSTTPTKDDATSDRHQIKATPSKLITGYLAGGASTRKNENVNTPLGSGLTPRRPLAGTASISRAAATRTPATEKLQQIFEQTIDIDENKVRQITLAMNKNKIASKFNATEKAKSMETAIKELQALIVTLLGQVKQVQIKCVGFESDTEAKLKEAHFHIQELTEANARLQSNENRLKQEISQAIERAAIAEANLKGAQKEGDPLRKTIKDLEGRIAKLVTDHAKEQAQAKAAKEETERLQKSITDLKKECDAAKEAIVAELKQASAEFEVRLANQRAELKKEHQAASANTVDELKRRAAQLLLDAATEKEEHKASLLRQEQRFDEQISSLKNDLATEREARGALSTKLSKTESGVERTAADLIRATAEVNKLSSHLTAKEEQLQTTLDDLRSAHALQKSLAAERASLHTEVAVLQQRAAAAEAEGHTLAAELAQSREQACSSHGELVATKEALVAMQAVVAAKDADLLRLKDAARQLEAEREIRERAERRESSERQERIAASAQLLATQTDCNARIANLEKKMRTDLDTVKAMHAQTLAELESSQAKCREHCDTIMGLENESTELRAQLEHACANHETVEKLGRVTGELEILKRRMRENSDSSHLEEAKLMGRIRELQEEVRQSEITRRKLHNTIQELRGNVRVFARVRPFLPSDGVDLMHLPEPTIIPRTDGTSMRIVREASDDCRGEDLAFAFDRVFGPSSSQESVFAEVSEFVQSALDGYHVCLFSYGQTGSGKTHTMQGSGSGSMRGIISRAMEQVGRYKTELESKGWEYHMEVSFIEIYNETIRDLLRANAVDDVKHEIKRDVNGNTTVTDVTMKVVDPNNVEQMSSIMELAAIHRSVGQTAMNERSSRSHSVFCLHLRASNAAQKIVLTGALNLVDLAGSERLDRSLATGARQTETVAINKSLSALTDVFVAIGNKQSHIPFRNSKLTYLLQPALSGDGKTLMMVNLSPTLESFGESVCSLRFASQVNQCELGKPKKQTHNDMSITTPQATKAAPAKIGSAVSVPSAPSTATSASRVPASATARKVAHR